MSEVIDAAVMQDWERVRHLVLNEHADASAADEFGWTALHFGAWRGVVQFFIRHLPRAALDLPASSSELTPLMLAAEGGHADAVGALALAGARLDARDAAGETALIRAARRANVAVVRTLLACGADPLCTCAAGTALSLVGRGCLEDESGGTEGTAAVLWRAVHAPPLFDTCVRWMRRHMHLYDRDVLRDMLPLHVWQESFAQWN